MGCSNLVVKWILFLVGKGLEDDPELAEDLLCSFFKNQPGELGLVTNVRTDWRYQLELLPLNPKRTSEQRERLSFSFLA